ncbi:MAG: transcriptional repressor [Bacteroidetes bacterium]|nr:transcriptional repressor [Bacteroidota bacterium]
MLTPDIYTQIRESLSAHGLKVTPQRVAIYGDVLQSIEHPTAEQVFANISTTHPGISLGTVYKTLDSLSEKGLIKKVKTGAGIQRFDARHENHHHLFCQKTQKIIDYTDPELEQLIASYFQKKKIQNFEVSGFELNINGEQIKTQPNN